ncbi:MAG: type II toxin-antitoxin system RelE/ParE family toxin [Spirochaetaceae bacterium]|nr:MAG: type II toxin-antitoxin system RelE/ParE family toxin [Spirochaetaceae bacterium]
MRTVRFYRKGNGECPVEAFLEGLPARSAAKVVAVLKLVEQQPTLSNRFLRKLRGTELFEVRVLASKQAYRLPCFFAGERLVVLTHGFNKKTEKTPRAEIRRAEEYREDYLRRQKNE